MEQEEIGSVRMFYAGRFSETASGGSPQITEGEHAGEKVALDHVLPRAVVPELDACFYNLEILAAKVNRAKSAKITEREVAIARRWRKQGLLSDAGLVAVERAAR